MSTEQPITIRQLYPHFTDEQLTEAEENLRFFAHVLAEIYQKRESRRASSLTDGQGSPTIHSERSNPPINQPN